MQLFNIGWYLLQFARIKNYILNEKSTSHMHCQNIKHIYIYIQLLKTVRGSKLNWSEVQHKLINHISKHSKHTQVCFFFFWEEEDVHRTNFDFDIQFENECKVSLVFHYLVKSEKYVLLYGGGDTAPPDILCFVWCFWTGSFQIVRYQDRCLYTSCMYIQTTITGKCGCLLLHILIPNIKIL